MNVVVILARPYGSVLVGMAVVTLMGCYGGGPEYAKVSGTVTHRGKPVAGGQITLVPPQGPSAFGTIERDGSFVLSTKRAGDGALVGSHKVAILPPTVGRTLESMTGGKADSTTSPSVIIPPYAQSIETSGIQCEVTRGENKLTIDLHD